MRYWKKKDTGAVESYSHELDLPKETHVEITEQEFNDFVANLPEPEPYFEPTFDEKVLIVLKREGLI